MSDVPGSALQLVLEAKLETRKLGRPVFRLINSLNRAINHQHCVLKNA